jgi:hypothetical protein
MKVKVIIFGRHSLPLHSLTRYSVVKSCSVQYAETSCCRFGPPRLNHQFHAQLERVLQPNFLRSTVRNLFDALDRYCGQRTRFAQRFLAEPVALVVLDMAFGICTDHLLPDRGLNIYVA